MAIGNGTPPPGSAEKSLGEIVNEVTEKASLLVREEIELAKAEMQEKVKRIGKGAAFAAVAGAFLLFMLIYFLEGVAWLVNDLFNDTSGIWICFFVVPIGLHGIGALCGALADRLVLAQVLHVGRHLVHEVVHAVHDRRHHEQAEPHDRGQDRQVDEEDRERARHPRAALVDVHGGPERDGQEDRDEDHVEDRADQEQQVERRCGGRSNQQHLEDRPRAWHCERRLKRASDAL
jgi:uncharacterized membrane protein YqjE